MEQNFNTIFHRPNAIMWSAMLTMWAFLVPSIICILIQTITENNLQGPLWELAETRTQHCKPSKRSTSEWLKWKQSWQDMVDNHQLNHQFCCIKRLTRKTVARWSKRTERLIVGWVNQLQVYLSTGYRRNRCFPHSGKRRQLKCKQKQCNNSWIPAYRLSQHLSAFASTSPRLSTDIRFDSDSYPVLIDNCCTACISNCRSDFCDRPRSM